LNVVPTIDLRAPIDETARAVDDACRRIGFFQIVGHGLDADLEARAWQLAHDVFALPDTDKHAVAIPSGDAYGYGPYRVERLAASLGDDTPPDLKETFSIGPFVTPAGVLADPAAAFVYSPNRWPDALPAMPATFHRYYDALALLVERVMETMAIGLGLDADWFAPHIDRHTSALRVLHYPDLRGVAIEPDQWRAGPHTDYGTLTLLRQDDAPGGLQVRDVDGAWHDVPAVAGAYVVNVGDALARWTNDRWRSTVHRVVVPPVDAARNHRNGTERFSLAFFHNANWDASLACIPTCVEDGEAPRYRPVLAGRHLMDKFLSTQRDG
jgi:isopenicillin N synthase-like dioxygenase